MGPWLTRAHALAFGSEDGSIHVYSDAGVKLMESTPSDRAGKFSFHMLVPEGGFYGSHLLVARIHWTTQAGVEQEARLVDWFEVVSKTGEPVPAPAYRLALSVAQRDLGDP